MKARYFMMPLVFILAISLVANAQMMKRTDAVWARNTTETITLDGKLSEASWAVADSIRLQFGKDSGIPGSGWYWENSLTRALDPTDATVKFLAKADTLYVGVVCKDKSIGAGLFNQFDGFLMNLRYRDVPFAGNPFKNRDNQAMELFYAWCSETWADTNTAAKGASPGFFGDFPSASNVTRPDSFKIIYDAKTFVRGSTNDDATPDTMYSTEFKFNLKKFNYNVTQAGGDVAMFGMMIYDADYRWPVDTTKWSGNRVWIQSPWGNASAVNHLRIWVRSDVTTTSGSAPALGPDLTIPDGKNYANITFDGRLTEDVWKAAPTLSLKYGDAALRATYPSTAKYRSGQQQATVNGAKNPVTDANTVGVKYFFKADTLFLGFDVRDKFVQGWKLMPSDRWDGFRITMAQRDARDGDSTLQRRQFTFRVDSAGAVSREEALSKSGWDSLGQAVQVALALKGGTTVDTAGTQADTGYTAEVKINLRKLGYAAGRGDGVVFFGINHYDGDTGPVTGATGTQVWFMRPNDWEDGFAWAYMDPSTVLTSVGDPGAAGPAEFALLGNYPNPFNPSTQIRFLAARTGEVTLKVYDIAGRLVGTKTLDITSPGEYSMTFDAHNLASGSYYYRLQHVSGAILSGKMMLLK